MKALMKMLFYLFIFNCKLIVTPKVSLYSCCNWKHGSGINAQLIFMAPQGRRNETDTNQNQRLIIRSKIKVISGWFYNYCILYYYSLLNKIETNLSFLFSLACFIMVYLAMFSS